MIILSCGHREDDFDAHYDVIVMSYNRDNTKALSYMTVCALCKTDYTTNGLLFDNEVSAYCWLSKEEIDEPSYQKTC